ncbi:MAG TPA: NAD(P)/FAD-dependent oxidoreductase [Steroidobacteraceae bacterium]|jgi:protoporphyrinogen oxidase
MSERERNVVIVGAGPAGLTAALELQKRTGFRPIVFDSDSQVGGISKTVNYRGNRMDLGGHRFFSKSDWVMKWWQEVLPIDGASAVNGHSIGIGYQNSFREFVPVIAQAQHEGATMLVRRRLSRIYYRRKFFDYPLKLNLRTLSNLGFGSTAAIGASYLAARMNPRRPEATLEDFLVNRFGDRLYKTFFKSYTEKVWGVPCHEISAEWGAQRIKGLSITKAIMHALHELLPRSRSVAQQDVETSLIERFLYPRLGPGQMWEAVADRVCAGGGEIHLRHKVIGIRRRGNRVEGIDVLNLDTLEARHIACNHLVSSMPIGELTRQLEPESGAVSIISAALPHRDFMTTGLLLRRMSGAATPPDNWIYVQEEDVRLGRIQIYNNWSPYLVADPDTVWLGLEYFCNAGDDLAGLTDAAFVSLAAAELEKIGLARREDVIDAHVIRVPKAYPAYFGEYRNIDQVRSWLDQIENVFPIGRNGMHRYNNQDHSMLTAKAAVDCMQSGSSDKRALWEVNTEDDYHEDRG